MFTETEISPLSAEEQTKFGGLDWVRDFYSTDYAPKFGVKRVTVGNEAGCTVIRMGKEVLEKKYVPGVYAVTISPDGTRYTNDNTFTVGPDGTRKGIKIVFEQGIDPDIEKYQAAATVAADICATIVQDRTSRQVRQAEMILRDSLRYSDGVFTSLLPRFSYGAVERESAVEQDLIGASRMILPASMRELADKAQNMGIKCIVDTLIERDVEYWPAGIKKSWTPQTDNMAWNDWAQKGLRVDPTH